MGAIGSNLGATVEMGAQRHRGHLLPSSCTELRTRWVGHNVPAGVHVAEHSSVNFMERPSDCAGQYTTYNEVLHQILQVSVEYEAEG